MNNVSATDDLAVPDEGLMGFERDQVHDRVDRVIDDLAKNRIHPAKVDALGRAVSTAKSHGGVFRAIGGGEGTKEIIIITEYG